MPAKDPTFARVADVVEGVPFMRARRARELMDLIRREQPAHVLEIGTSHGVSTCYMAAAVAEYGGRVTTMDRIGNENLQPNVFDLLEQLDLTDHVDVNMAERSFTWELMKIMRDQPEQRFDFCFFDAGHVWDVTGYAFFLVDRLLNPGSWILFDDLEWTIATSPSLSGKGVPEEEATTKQVSLVFDLLVGRHESYGQLRRDGNWGWARKRPAEPSTGLADGAHEAAARARARARTLAGRARRRVGGLIRR